MRTSLMQKLAVTCIAAFALLGGIGAANAEMHGAGSGFHGGAEFHDGGGFHGDGFHDGGRFHDGGFHGGAFPGHSHIRAFIGAPIIFGPGYYPYDYSYPYEDAPFTFYGDPDATDVEPQNSGSNNWYCRDPAGYYPDVQTCPSGWMQVMPNN